MAADLHPLRAAAALAGALAACSSPRHTPSPAPASSDAPAAPADGWQCFVMAPDTQMLPQGNVTHFKRRITATEMQVHNVNVHPEGTHVTHLALAREGDRFQARMGSGTVTVQLLTPDGARSMLQYRDPSGWEFTDLTTIDRDGMTIVSTDSGPDGPVETTTHFLPAPCAVIDAEIARYDH